MTRINKYATIQPANIETNETKTEPAVTNQTQSETVNSTPSLANSANTWQRASLFQDGVVQQVKLHNRLIEANRSDLRNEKENLEEELKRKQSELAEKRDRAVFENIGNFLGFDDGESCLADAAQATNSNPLKDLLMQAATKIEDPDDD
jgi:hypothetical protein